MVGIVLNAIDDALDKGKQGPAHWTLDQVGYLRPVLDEARRAGCPVILTADHGHVLDQGERASLAASESARYRTGTPGPGEITVRGPRVVVDGEEVVAAVNEKIHYTARRAGYHGGASLAEVVVPVIILLPSDSLLPAGWHAYDAAGHAPAWWDAPASRATQLSAPGQAADPAKPAPSRRKRAATVRRTATRSSTSQKRHRTRGNRRSLRSPSAAGLSPRPGWQASGSDPPSPGRGRRRRADRRARPAGGRLTLPEAAAVTGQPAVRMSRYLAQVARLLNVDSYAVLNHSEADRLVELNLPLLRQQFLGE